MPENPPRGLNVLMSHPERLTKSAVCSDATKVLIEDKKGITRRVLEIAVPEVRLQRPPVEPSFASSKLQACRSI
jgi:hypothetical protein